MTRTNIKQEYFEWIYSLMSSGRFAEENSYRMLLTQLHEIEFIYIIQKDSNRAEDGESLRYRFAWDVYHYDSRDYIIDCLARPCSVLEMLVALAIRCEETMDDPAIGDRTGQWFWMMITNLGLGGMYDRTYDAIYVNKIVHRFLYREYASDGTGGLFCIPNCKYDMREEEVWTQMLWFLDTII